MGNYVVVLNVEKHYRGFFIPFPRVLYSNTEANNRNPKFRHFKGNQHGNLDYDR